MSEPEDLRKVEPAKSKPKRVHTPTVLQMEAVECGAAALASVLAYFGRWVPLEKLRIQCGVSRDGSSAGNLMAAARAYGLKAQGKRLNPKDLGKYSFPLIVHWEFDHFMVVEGTDGSGVFLNDPSQGPRKLPWKEFEAGFAGVAIAFEKSSEFKPGGQPPSVLRALRRRLKGSEAALAYVVIVSVLLVLPGLALPTFVRTFVDKVLVGGLDGWLRPLILGLAMSAVLSGALTAMQQYTLRAMETRLSLTSSSKFFWHVLRLPMDFYSQRYAGDVGSRVALNDHVAELLSGQLATACLNMIVIALYAALMFTYDVRLTVISIVIAAINLLVLSLVSRKRRDGNALVMQEEGKLMGMASGGLQIIETLKATGTESNFFARWAGQDAKVLNAQQRLGVYTQILTVVPSFLTMLNTALILWIGAGRVIDGRMSLGMLVAFQTLATSFMTPVTQLVGLGTALQEVNGSLLRLDDVLRYEADPRLNEEEPVSSEQPARLAGKVELRDVTFGYSPLAPPLIEGLNLTLNPGDRVAIVGGTGSGKSTLARLVSGLNRPWEGEILFDDQPIDSIPRHILTDSIAHVDQEIALFEGTLRDNLTLWESDITQASLVRAARDAAIHDGIMNRENGYTTAVAEGGANFSGGQRQRLEIARTLVGDPTILVLDEATSALDPIVEGMIDNHLRRRGCTCLIIAHRLSTIRDCSEIIVLEQGQVVERGTHAEMIGHDGPYRRLIQAELASEPEADIRADETLEEPEEQAPELGDEWEKRTSYRLGPDTRGFVKKGFVDVFAVAGPRRFLARFTEGQAFFGMPEDPKMSLVGVPGSDSVIVDVEGAQPGPWMVALGGSAAGKLSEFQEKLLASLKEMREHAVESDLARAERRQKEGDAAVSGALHSLACIMGTPREVTFEGEDPLLAATRLVASANGIGITAPKHMSESESEALEDIARASHFRHRRVVLRSDWWSCDNGPLLGFRAGKPNSEAPAEARGGASSVEPCLGAPVALLPRSPSRYDSVDPVEKTRAKVSAKSDLSAIAYQLYRPLPNLVLNARALLQFALRGCRRDLITMGVMGLLAGLLGMALPLITGFLVNQVIPSADRQQVLIMGMLLLVITVSSALFEFTRAIAVQRIEGKMDGAVQPAIWDRILALPTSFFRRYSAGDLASRAMTIESIRETVTGATVSAVLGAIFSVFSLGLMFYYDASLAGLAMIPIGALGVFTVVAGLMQVRLERQLLHVQGRISGLVLQLLNGISKIRIAGAEGRAFARWGKEFAEQKELSWRQLGVTNLISVVNSTFGMLGAIVLFLGVALPPKGAARLSTGDFMAFYAAFGQFAGALLALSSSLTSTLSVLPMFERARPILEALPEISELKTHPGKLKGDIELSHVNFCYTPGGPQVLTDVSVRAGVGEFVAIVGASGSGKSTLFRHLLGFEKPDSGAIYFDGQDLQDVDLSAVRRQMGVVLQDSKLMPGDILQNVLGSSGRTPQDALDALKSAGMEKDLEGMPMGLHTVVMEGGGAFSGGQRQRLLIARAIVGKPRILLFDEATSALDSETQESVTRNLESLKVTRIVIAHRLSTIRNADRIYVMDAGRVVQVGTFDELMKQGGTFEKLVRPQTIA